MSFSAAQKHLFYSEIAKLLEAGFGIREAARVMLDSRVPSGQAALLRTMEGQLESGGTITEAFGKGSSAITPMERSIVGAGERGGRMAPAFQHLADYFGMLARAQKDGLQATLYPLFLLHLGIFLPYMIKLVSGSAPEAEVWTGFGITLAIAYAVCFLIWLAIRAALKAAESNSSLDTTIHSLPLFGPARRSMVMARFSKVYHTGLLAGLSMRETVESAAEASRSGRVHRAAGMMQKVLDEGGALGPSFIASGAFPNAFARSYATAEESGSVDKDLARWSKVFEEDAARNTRTLASALPKIAYFLVLIFVAWKIISFYSTNMFGPLRDLDN